MICVWRVREYRWMTASASGIHIVSSSGLYLTIDKVCAFKTYNTNKISLIHKSEIVSFWYHSYTFYNLSFYNSINYLVISKITQYVRYIVATRLCNGVHEAYWKMENILTTENQEMLERRKRYRENDLTSNWSVYRCRCRQNKRKTHGQS